MDFFEHQEHARRRTSLLVFYFVVAVVLIIICVYLAVAAVLFWGQNRGGDGPATLWFPDVFVVVSLGTIVLISIGSFVKTAQLAGGGEAVARSLGGRPVSGNTRDLRERVLLNVVEEMAIASGTPVPPVYLLEGESGINAFAAGTTPQNAVIGITRGSIETLKRDELQGVIAHEFSHILNGDMRLNLRLIGLLNGILLIATIGYFLMRSGYYSSNFSSSSDDNKKGGNPLPLLGLCFYIIGYIGVFFGHLIKSAVSRQREFLADASAVQFTRYPDGICGALKKIGGFAFGSKLQTPNAEEASHMYFGNGLTAPFLQLLATHPPLAERIKRIDPKFSGVFSSVGQVDYSEADLVDPGSLASRLAAPASAHQAAATGAQKIAFHPAAAVAQVGAPRMAHLDYAANLLDSLPPALSRDIRDPLGAVAIIYALLLNDDDPEIRQVQLNYLATKTDPRANEETLRLAPVIPQLNPEARLPLVSMALPALKALSSNQLNAFVADATFLIRADNQVTLFEYAVHRLVLKRLLPRLQKKPAKDVKYDSLSQLSNVCGDLLSTLAYFGSRDDDQATQAFKMGAEKFGDMSPPLAMLSREKCGLQLVDTALDRFAAAAPMLKKRLIEACAACIGADGRVTIEEGELLRVISDALDCPMPPLLDQPSVQSV